MSDHWYEFVLSVLQHTVHVWIISSRMKFDRLGDALPDEIVLFSVHNILRRNLASWRHSRAWKPLPCRVKFILTVNGRIKFSELVYMLSLWEINIMKHFTRADQRKFATKFRDSILIMLCAFLHREISREVDLQTKTPAILILTAPKTLDSCR